MSRQILEQSVSRETFRKLETYADLLIQWNPKINLVSKSTIPDLWDRHIFDSAQIYENAPEKFASWLDIGSGGGFPGLVASIYASEKQPEARFTLIESDQRKCAFLRTVARECGLRVSVTAKRIEAVDPIGADVLSARALAALPELLEFADRHLAADGTALFPKGARWRDEVDAAEKLWRFHWDALPSKTDSEAVILKIGGIERVQSA